jgi:hypothetical protein
MAFKCKGDWDSWTDVTFPPEDPPNDGLIVVGKEAPNGKFKGKHKKTKKKKDGKPEEVEHELSGTCKKSPDKIEFKTNEGFTYRGEITEKEFKKVKKPVIEGTRSDPRNRVKAEEEWVAVKVGV